VLRDIVSEARPSAQGQTPLVERDPEQLGVVDGAEIEIKEQRDQYSPADLEEELLPSHQAIAAVLARGGGQLEPVVDATEDPEPEQYEKRLLDEGVVQLGPEQCRDDGRGKDDQATHGRGVGFLLGQLVQGGVVKLGPVADLHAHQPADDLRADQEGDGQRSQDRHDRAEHDVLIGVEVQLLAEKIAEILQQVIDHLQLMNDY